MGHWSFYFLAKLGLYYTGRISFHWGLNLLLALALLWPLAHKRWRWARTLLVWPLALALLYYESYLPPLGRVLSQASALASFRWDYLAELLGRVVSLQQLGAAAAVVALYLLLARRIRFATVAVLGIVSVPLWSWWMAAAPHTLPTAAGIAAAPGAAATSSASATAAAQDPSAQLQAFYTQQAERVLSPSLPANTPPPFDIVVLQVCSLSWDDMDFVGIHNPALLQRFDAVFSQFNSAASYSGPAALRLMRGTCGQTSHHDLYEGADPACYLFPTLEQLGYRTHGLLNHDGAFDDFAKMLQLRGGLSGQLEIPTSAPVAMRNFDGSPIYSDAAVLRQWWQQRQTQGEQPVALYYNTVSLHDGNQIEGVASRSSLDTYQPRLTKLLADLDQFITELERTNRPVLLLLIPEHGAALRGDKFQIAGMREIPNPRITFVPAAMKLIGMPNATATAPQHIDTPVSYYDINALVMDMIAHSPLAPQAPSLAERLHTISNTPFVAENDDVVVLQKASQDYVMRSGKNAAWVGYTP